MQIKKRSILKYGLGAFTAFVGYSVYRGFRYPPLMWTIRYDDGDYERGHADIQTNDAILLKKQYSLDVSQALLSLPNTAKTFLFRAYAPEPIIRINAKQGSAFAVVVNNVHSDAQWKIDAGKDVDIIALGGTNHLIVGKTDSSEQLIVQAKFIREDGFRFASIGDSGGDLELDWCLHRAKQLNADFLLHLGDFVYSDGDYERAVRKFHQADLPCYIAIGNHDFHNSGKIFQPYINELGVFSHQFRLQGCDFINLDTANAFYPPSAGDRGKLLNDMRRRMSDSLGSQQHQSKFAFSHKPIEDMRVGEDHNISGVGEAEWFKEQFKELAVSHFMCGHVHHRFENDLDGVLQLTAGEGLSHEDLYQNKNISSMLVIQKEPGLAAQHEWKSLDMPIESYANPVHIKYLKRKPVPVDLKPYLEKYPNLKLFKEKA